MTQHPPGCWLVPLIVIGMVVWLVGLWFLIRRLILL